MQNGATAEDNFSSIENFLGSQVADTISGSTAANLLNGLAGDDSLEGKEGDDTLEGREGNDTLFGNQNSDVLTGGAGNDLLDGGAEIDVLEGNEGDDTLDGGSDSDLLRGGAGNDTYSLTLATAGGDIIEDTGGSDTLTLLTTEDNSATITLSEPSEGTIGISKQESFLVIDINRDGILDAEDDLSIANFFNESGNASGSGLIENIANLSSTEILNFFDATETSPVIEALDIDGSGGVLQSSDYTLINLYASFGSDSALFDVLLQDYSDILLGENATRSTGAEIINHLDSIRETIFDIDGNSTIETSDYTLLDLYGSFGADSALFDIFLEQYSDVLLGEGATRNMGTIIVDYFT